VNLVSDIWSVLTTRQRRWILGAQVLSILMAFSTVAGIASIAPFFSILGNPNLIDQTGVLTWLYHFGFSSRRSFTVALGLVLMGLVLLANLINVIGSFAMIRAGSATRSQRGVVAYSRSYRSWTCRRERLGKNDIGRSDRGIARARNRTDRSRWNRS
jgi:hypothetical protein